MASTPAASTAGGPSPASPSAAPKAEPPSSSAPPNQPSTSRWLPALVSSSHFFQPCARCCAPRAKGEGGGLVSYAPPSPQKTAVNYICLTCADPAGLCQTCMADHTGHYVMQIRRSSYHNVVRLQDLTKLVNTEGIQT